MNVRLIKPWTPLTPAGLARVRAHMGVYEIADASGQVVFIGSAGGKSLFGLRGELEREMAARGPDHQFRCEVNTQYTTRRKELLMVHRADHGGPPRDNRK